MLWGTDSIWYGSPQDQIQAFRAFQISPEFRERYGYPEITPAIRAKVFGRNALKLYPVPEDVLSKHLSKRRGGARARELPQRARPALRHLRAEDAARVPQPATARGGLARSPIPTDCCTQKDMAPPKRGRTSR